MNLISEIEISYFRSFYKFRLRNASDMNIIFGKNDSGKSNVVRALNLFFNGKPDTTQPFDFNTDFCYQRLQEANDETNVRKFLYVKITFNTPNNYKKSLGDKFYVKRQWAISRGSEYNQEFSAEIPENLHYIATRLLNKIRFIYIPAIKDISIFEMLLSNIYETVSSSDVFDEAMDAFSLKVQNLTEDLFTTLPKEVSAGTKIGRPTQMNQLFRTLDFETVSDGEITPRSLTRQRGDGIKARHIPEILSYISDHDQYDFHIWGFEEPENSLDFVAAQAEAKRFQAIAAKKSTQIFITTHSPSFYLLEGKSTTKFYIRKSDSNISEPLQGKELDKFDAQAAVGEGFYLPAVAMELEKISDLEKQIQEAESAAATIEEELTAIATPVILTEGRTDTRILSTAWSKLFDAPPPFCIKSCETTGPEAQTGNGGAQTLAICLKAVRPDTPHIVIGVFDHDDAGIAQWKLDANFKVQKILGHAVNSATNGRAYAITLPPPDFRMECAEHENLPIEYLFSDADLSRDVNGQRLGLTPIQASTKMGKKIIRKDLGKETHFLRVTSGKSFFSDHIVPDLPAESFNGFRPLFELILNIINQ